ncbi:hypothetical protein COJ46_02535 [Bacillus sp. AFS077874]|nr:hypothetical protein COJ46_02535 [Bacillus sp. AFS077874]
MGCNNKRALVVTLLLYYSSTNKHKPISIPTDKLSECGISRQTYYHVIDSLEKEQLVQTIKEPGRKMKVKLLGATEEFK